MPAATSIGRAGSQCNLLQAALTGRLWSQRGGADDKSIEIREMRCA